MEITSWTIAIEPARGPGDDPQDIIGGDHNDGGKNDEDGVVHGPKVLAHVDLAKTVGMSRMTPAICLPIG